MIKILFFGELADAMDVREQNLPFVEGLTTQKIRDDLAKKHPEAFAKIFAIALNGKRLTDFSAILKKGDELVFMPPFAGG